VIVTHNSASVIEPLLDSLVDAMGELTSVTVVVDNGSVDATVDVVRNRADCLLVEGRNVGYAAGVNRGAAEVPLARSILVLNPDVVLDPGSVPAMQRALSRPGVGIVAPLVREVDGETSWSLRREPTIRRALGLGRTAHAVFSEYVTSREDYRHGHFVDWAVGAILLVSRECHEAVSGWDESYFLYSEETDLSLRARDLGFGTWFEPSAGSMHVGGASGTSGATQAMQATNRVRLYRRRHGPVASACYWLLTLLGEVSWWVRGNPLSRHAVGSLLIPHQRPPELGASDRLLPR
jgi:GT2 family glycosyltransferase